MPAELAAPRLPAPLTGPSGAGLVSGLPSVIGARMGAFFKYTSELNGGAP
jgi:hypothetical protein